MSDETPSPESGSGAVGYGNPPEQTRFQKGLSGNPKGRPKGALNIATVLAKTLRERVVINENGQRKTVTKLEAAVKQLVNKSASGDLRALRQLIDLALSAEERTGQAPLSDSALSEVDTKIVQGILERLENTDKGEE